MEIPAAARKKRMEEIYAPVMQRQQQPFIIDTISRVAMRGCRIVDDGGGGWVARKGKRRNVKKKRLVWVVQC